MTGEIQLECMEAIIREEEIQGEGVSWEAVK